MLKRIFLMLFSFTFLNANTVEFAGKFEPGFLVFGKGEKIRQVMLDSKIVDVDENGYFVLGFDRDAKGPKYLKIKYESGKSFVKKINLPEREYKIQEAIEMLDKAYNKKKK